MGKHIFTEDKAMVFDLEFTSWPGSNERNWSLPNEDREIIQIGAVKIETTISLLVDFRDFLFPIENLYPSNQRVAFK